MTRPKIVCILGSTKFKDLMMGVAQQETLKGHIVLTHGFWHHVDKYPITNEAKDMLDDLMLHKVRLSDECHVVNPNGYIGESTKRAIALAKELGRPLRYTDPASIPANIGR
jgi:hypothetical protein